MDLGPFLYSKISEKGISETFQVYKEELSKMHIDKQSYRQRIYRLNNKTGPILTDDMDFLRIVLSICDLSFEDLFSIDQTNNGLSNKSDVYLLKHIQKMEQDIRYIRLKLDKSKKKHSTRAIRIFYLNRLTYELSNFNNIAKKNDIFLNMNNSSLYNSYILKQIFIPYLYTDDIVNDCCHSLLSEYQSSTKSNYKLCIVGTYLIIINLYKEVCFSAGSHSFYHENDNDLFLQTKIILKQLLETIFDTNDVIFTPNLEQEFTHTCKRFIDILIKILLIDTNYNFSMNSFFNECVKISEFNSDESLTNMIINNDILLNIKNDFIETRNAFSEINVLLKE